MVSRLGRVRVGYLLPALACLLLTGCVQVKETGDEALFTFESWVGVSALLGSIAGFAVGIYFPATWSTYTKWVLRIGSPIALVVFVPGFFLDHVKVDPAGFTVQDGFWFSPDVETVKFADVSSIEQTMTESRGRRGRKNTNYYLHFHYKDGREVTLSVGELLKGGAGTEILRRAQALSIPYEDRTGE